MAFKGVTFAGQNVTPKDDGALYFAHYGDGILDGCSMAISGDDLVIQSGHFIAGGRVCHVDGATNVDLSTRTLTNGYIQVVMDYDISKPEGNQWNIHMPLIESATTTFPTLTTDDINGTGTLYQLQLAVVQISGGNLTSITSSLGGSDLIINGTSNNPVLSLNVAGVGKGFVFYDNTNTATRVWNQSGNNGVVLEDDGTTIVHANGKNILLRPNGRANTTGQLYVNSSGGVYFSGQTIGNSYGTFSLQNNNLIIGCDSASGNVILRPTGVNDSSKQFYIDSNGWIHSAPTYQRSAGGSANVVVASGGDFYRSTSLRKYKKDIRPITEEEAEKGYKLEPIGFHSNIEGDTEHELYGFIAEDVEEILPNLATHDEDGKVDGVAYDRVCAILLKQNQMLKARVDALEKRVEKLEGK